MKDEPSYFNKRMVDVYIAALSLGSAGFINFIIKDANLFFGLMLYASIFIGVVMALRCLIQQINENRTVSVEKDATNKQE